MLVWEGTRRKQNFEILGFKSDTAVLTFTFCFLSSPLFSLFLPHFSFFCWGFRRLYFGGKIFWGKLLGLEPRKGRSVVEQDFHEHFRVNVTWFFTFFSVVLDWIVLILERSRHFAHVSGQSWHWPLKPMTSQAVEETWIRTGGYGRFRGEWVDKICMMASKTDNSQTLKDDTINIKQSFIPLPPDSPYPLPPPTVPGSPGRYWRGIGSEGVWELSQARL